jgi:hypothetical protein
MGGYFVRIHTEEQRFRSIAMSHGMEPTNEFCVTVGYYGEIYNCVTRQSHAGDTLLHLVLGD